MAANNDHKDRLI
jgi:hypothetical protein